MDPERELYEVPDLVLLELVLLREELDPSGGEVVSDPVVTLAQAKASIG
jgi:hypothetical protein